MTDVEYGFTKDTTAAQSVAPHLNPLPRSVLRPAPDPDQPQQPLG